MRNLAVKFSILQSRFKRESSPQQFLGLTPAECLWLYKRCLPEPVRGKLMFAFSDRALLEIINQELDVDMTRMQLVFRKPTLDAESIRIAGGVRRTFASDEAQWISQLSSWMLQVTRPLYRVDLPEAQLTDILREYQENLKIYLEKHSTAESNKLSLMLSNRRAMVNFTHAMTVDALFKADAARAILGDDSSYAQAWVRKQMFRHMLSRSLEKQFFKMVA